MNTVTDAVDVWRVPLWSATFSASTTRSYETDSIREQRFLPRLVNVNISCVQKK
ncbi:hypothetical protein DPMN_146002 [Dreissena polymorpha]|uniref:Uncharacterized protein n=1 Tax=Dreissena polymorpha TaxID=45954 RepID=A0A9D4F547_DREPO|nr:hypothetical protein DPMN_146002 [Dreissena polymorpha]